MSSDRTASPPVFCDVTECACGHITLTVGRVRLDMSRAEFSELYRLLSAAACRMGLEATAAASPPVKAVTH